MTFAILHKDLGSFCIALMVFSHDWRRLTHTYQRRSLCSNKVTVVDPYNRDKISSSRPFFFRKLQQKLKAPYRSIIGGFPGFYINGAIPEVLARLALAKVSALPVEDHHGILHELKELDAKGNYYLHNKDFLMATRIFQYAMDRIQGCNAFWQHRNAMNIRYCVASLEVDMSSKLIEIRI